MRYFLAIGGVVAAVIVFLIDANVRTELPFGAYLVPSVMILAAALWGSVEEDRNFHLVYMKTFGVLANGPLKMKDLIEKLNEGQYSEQWDLRHRAGVGRMLEMGDLVVADGMVQIPGRGE